MPGNPVTRQLQTPEDRIDGEGCRHAGCLPWLIVAGAALIIHQLTGNTTLAAALLYAQAWWKPFRCGLWLCGVDPLASRGRACFWFYLAMACWNAAASAFTTVVVFMAVDSLTGRPPPMDELAMTMLTLAGGVCLSTVIGIIAVTFALYGKVRIWAHPGVRERCRGDFSRVGNPGRVYHGFNHAVFVVAMALFFPFLATGIGLLIWGAANDRPNEVRTVTALIEVFFLLVGPLAMIPVYAFLSSRIIARTPADCWPPSAAR
jgi:hypothetical protein